MIWLAVCLRLSDLIGAFPGFLVYASVLLLLCLVLIFYLSPRYGNSNILIYISICSLLGAFTVSSVKGLGFAIRTGKEEIWREGTRKRGRNLESFCMI